MVGFVGRVRLASLPAKPLPDGSGYYLYHPLERKLGWFWVTFATPFLIAGAYFGFVESQIAGGLFLIVPSGLSFLLGIHYLMVATRRLEVTASALSLHGYNINVTIPWSQVQKLTFSPGSSSLEIHGENAETIHVDKTFLGVVTLLQDIKKRHPTLAEAIALQYYPLD